MGNEVFLLEVDGRFENLEEMVYVENYFSKIGIKYYGEMIELLFKYKDYLGIDNGIGLF